MCCFMENHLAKTLAEFELKLEKEVLEPLNKLSEVRAAGARGFQTLLDENESL